MSRIEKMANEPVFQLQFNMSEAVRYVQRNAQVNYQTARQAIQQTVTFHRQ
jgi:hypothetical protein